MLLPPNSYAFTQKYHFPVIFISFFRDYYIQKNPSIFNECIIMLTHPYYPFSAAFSLKNHINRSHIVSHCVSHSSFFILHSSFFILHYPFYILHLRKPLCQPRYQLIYQVPNCPFIPSTPRQNKEYQDSNVRFSLFYDIISRKMSKFASNSCII